ncbi:MAG: AAA family ATPase [Erysipelotrichaceae bacterium]|nr:AAA family ATPase [Erysipelotrichaceae bacterium]
MQVLEDDVLHDDFLNENISFSDCILIFTTNAGRSLYDSSERKLSLIPRETVIRALSKEKKENGELAIPTALLSRLSAGRLIMFDHMEVDSLMKIIEYHQKKYAVNFRKNNNIAIEYDDDVAASILYSIGASADARRAAAQTDNFINNSIMSLIRNLNSNTQEEQLKLKTIRFVCDQSQDPQIKALFTIDDDLKTLFFGFKGKHQALKISAMDRAENVEDALKKLGNGNYDLFLCDVHYWNLNKDPKQRKRPLSAIREETNGRILMEKVLEEYPQIPVYVIEDERQRFNAADRIALARLGVRGVFNMDDPDFAKQLAKARKALAQQRKIYELGRSNSSARFNVTEYVSPDLEEASIRLCEYELTRNIDAGDEGSIMDKLSMPEDSFEQVIGQKHVIDEMKFFIEYLKDPRCFKDRIVMVPKGLLMYGPAGTGKTMLARAFAHEAGLAFMAVQGNDFTGFDGADKLHQTFATARKYAPAVIFIDEIDALAKIRTGIDTYQENALTALLTEMDGFSSKQNNPVFVIGATNYNVSGGQMSLDPAVVRRFDNQLFVDLPDKNDRMASLRRQIKAHKEQFDLSGSEIESVAFRTVGRSFAWLQSLINMALRMMIINGWDVIDDERFEKALGTFADGEERIMSDEAILMTARHEAGHALINRYYGIPISYITITSRGNYGGYVQFDYDESKTNMTMKDLRSRIAAYLAGRAAEIVYYGNEAGINTGAYSDLESATLIASEMISCYGMDDEYGMAVFKADINDPIFHRTVSQIMEKEMEKDIAIITENRELLDRLVNELIKKNHLNKDEMEAIFKGNIKSV